MRTGNGRGAGKRRDGRSLGLSPAALALRFRWNQKEKLRSRRRSKWLEQAGGQSYMFKPIRNLKVKESGETTSSSGADQNPRNPRGF